MEILEFYVTPGCDVPSFDRGAVQDDGGSIKGCPYSGALATRSDSEAGLGVCVLLMSEFFKDVGW